MPFQIIRVEDGEAMFDPSTMLPYAFETGDAAQERAKSMAADGHKYRVKRVLDPHWRKREQRKFDNGTYQYLFWVREGWWRCDDACAIHKDHFPHPSKKEPGMIAFIESEEKGMDGLHTRIKPGRYLEKFKDVAYKYGIDLLVYIKRFESLHSKKTVFFAKTADEIEAVYRRGPESCMSSDSYRRKQGWGWPEPGKWPLDQHACRVYAAGDLQVAYLLEDDEKPKSKVIARSLVWPEKKTHSRCYGDEVRLKLLLGAAGYTFRPPVGAKLTRVPVNRQFLVPYIDQGDRTGQGALAIKDCKTHLQIVVQATGTYPANATSGLSGGRYMADGSMDDGQGLCAHCEEEHETQRVYMGNAPGDYQHWCQECIEDNGDIFTCAGSGALFHPPCLPVIMYNEETWSHAYFSRHGFQCQGNGKNYPTLHKRIVKYDSSGRIAYWSAEYCEGRTFRCSYTGDLYTNDQKVDMANGGVWSRHAVHHAGFVCTECHSTHPAYNSHESAGKLCLVCAAKLVTAPEKRKKAKTVTATPTNPNEAIDALVASLRNPEEQTRDRI